MGIGTYKVHCATHGLTRTSSEEGVCPECTPSAVDVNVQEHTTAKRGNPTETNIVYPVADEPEPDPEE